MNSYLSLKIQVISFLAMIMVVFLHSYNLPFLLNSEVGLNTYSVNSYLQIYISQGLTRVAVPLFFIISGYLFFVKIEKGTLKEFIPGIHKRFKTLVLPYIFWSLWGLLIFIILQTIPFSKKFFNNEFVTNYTIDKIIHTILLNPLPYQLWFIRDLFIFVILSPLIYWILKHFNLIPIIFFFISWFFNTNYIFFTNESILFFSIGAFISIQKKEFLKFKFDRHHWIYVFTWITVIGIKTSLTLSDFHNSIIINLLHKVSILVGIVAIWSSYDIIFKEKTINRRPYLLMSFSFFLYVFHEPTLTILKKGLFYITGKSDFTMLVIFFLAPLLTITVCIIIGYQLKKIVPTFYVKVTGGR